MEKRTSVSDETSTREGQTGPQTLTVTADIHGPPPATDHDCDTPVTVWPAEEVPDIQDLPPQHQRIVQDVVDEIKAMLAVPNHPRILEYYADRKGEHVRIHLLEKLVNRIDVKAVDIIYSTLTESLPPGKAIQLNNPAEYAAFKFLLQKLDSLDESTSQSRQQTETEKEENQADIHVGDLTKDSEMSDPAQDEADTEVETGTESEYDDDDSVKDQTFNFEQEKELKRKERKRQRQLIKLQDRGCYSSEESLFSSGGEESTDEDPSQDNEGPSQQEQLHKKRPQKSTRHKSQQYSKEQTRQKVKQLRKKVACPVPGCGQMVVKLTRHLTSSKHKWTTEQAKRAHLKHKRPSVKSKTRVCGFPGCGELHTRLGDHLTIIHKLPKDHPDHDRYMGRKPAAQQGMTTEEDTWLPQRDRALWKDFREQLVITGTSSADSKTAVNRVFDMLKSSDEHIRLDHIFNIQQDQVDDHTAAEHLKAAYFMPKLTFCLEDPSKASREVNVLIAADKFLYFAISRKRAYLERNHISRRQMKVLRSYIADWKKRLSQIKRHRAISINEAAAENPLPMAQLSARKAHYERQMMQMRIDGTVKGTAEALEYRNCLLSTLLVVNASRNSEIINMTMEEAKTATMDQTTHWYSIRVQQHKTAATYGSANVVMPPEMYLAFKFYLEEVRGKIMDNPQLDTTSLVFISRTGKNISSSHMTKILKSHMQARQGQIRKAYGAQTRHNPEAEQRIISKKMRHTDDVHRKTYQPLTNREDDIRAAMIMNQTLNRAAEEEVVSLAARQIFRQVQKQPRIIPATITSAEQEDSEPESTPVQSPPPRSAPASPRSAPASPRSPTPPPTARPPRSTPTPSATQEQTSTAPPDSEYLIQTLLNKDDVPESIASWYALEEEQLLKKDVPYDYKRAMAVFNEDHHKLLHKYFGRYRGQGLKRETIREIVKAFPECHAAFSKYLQVKPGKQTDDYTDKLRDKIRSFKNN